MSVIDFKNVRAYLDVKLCVKNILMETKLDSSFQNTIYEVPGYKLERKDRNIHGGGIAAYTRSDVASSRRKDLECDNLENIIIEVPSVKTEHYGRRSFRYAAPVL
ncbi:hypothetical protein DPMN_191835 [Dreissena polymorpha]|uniref:Uncharacterized protein n=1 Tax=Dreissena polymorpha TaxID=45954 RepID=A0A9D3XXN4_DREPO|nr:hypothetical protein DPMN_191835 [Dreissena polymorpha]